MAELDRETLARVRDAQLDALERWVASPDAVGRYSARLEEVVAHLETLAVKDLIDAEAVDRLVEALGRPEVAADTVSPAVRHLAAEVLAQLDVRPESGGEIIGEAARGEIADLAARADVLNEPLLRAVVQDPAVEGVLRDILFDGLKEFQTRVNPFTAEWGVPALIGAMPRLSRGPLTKAVDGVRREFERRLEPEMRKFLERFASKALDRTVTSMLDKAGDPEAVALRRQVAAVLLEQPLSTLAFAPPDARGEHLVKTIAAAVPHAIAHPAVRSMVGAGLRAQLDALGDHTVGDARQSLGIARPDLGPLAAASWPVVKAVLLAPAVRAQISEVIDQAHEALLEG